MSWNYFGQGNLASGTANAIKTGADRFFFGIIPLDLRQRGADRSLLTLGQAQVAFPSSSQHRLSILPRVLRETLKVDFQYRLHVFQLPTTEARCRKSGGLTFERALSDDLTDHFCLPLAFGGGGVGVGGGL